MSLLDVIGRIAEHRLVDFVAPIPDADETMVFSMLSDGTPYRFRVRADPGWWVVRPGKKAEASVIGSAAVWDMVDYLGSLPRFLVTAVLPLSETAWLCLPYSAADAEQRGWPRGEPRPLHLVRERINALDLVVARSLAGTLLYDELSVRLPGRHTHVIQQQIGQPGEIDLGGVSLDICNAVSLIRQRQVQEQVRQRAEEHRQTETDDEQRLRAELDFSGARLVNWSRLRDGFQVTWEHDGHQYTMPIHRDLRVETAGICLNDTDRHYTLAAIVYVMDEARKQHRTGA